MGEIGRDRIVIRLAERLKKIVVDRRVIGWYRIVEIGSDGQMITLTERLKNIEVDRQEIEEYRDGLPRDTRI